VKASKSGKPQRQTLAKQIRAFAQTDLIEAIIMAQHGRSLTMIEQDIHAHAKDWSQLTGKKIQDMIEDTLSEEAAKKFMSDHRRTLTESIAKRREKFCNVLIEAIEKNDAETVFEFARAVELHKSNEVQDRLRYEILLARWFAERRKISLPIRQLAEIVGWPVKDSPDGFAQLRRLCKELKYPLAPSRQTKRK
jgi:hypothetical protein